MQTAYARMVYDRHQRNQRADGGRARRRATLAHLLKDACRRLIAFLFTQVGVCGLVVAYNIMGAFAFRAIEGEYGDAAPEEAALQLREDAVKRLWNITARLNILEQTKWRQEVTRALEDFQGDVVPLVKAKGYRGVLPSQAWSFSAALMYSLSVYTTIVANVMECVVTVAPHMHNEPVPHFGREWLVGVTLYRQVAGPSGPDMGGCGKERELVWS
ncbi:hypothetical protein E2C01_017539 [Portunus trituberculatus]|uniref:Uncharacterized protein n=1 Tax=Portunus trituberculatus TaxID=210409 RepID=A0A5B7DSS7_PORTR|nr:hypothetical protein [Portunus trituberculatus]